MSVVVYGIPNCDTVRKARRWLEDRGVAHDFVDFRKTPVAPEKVEGWVNSLGSKPMKNTSGGSYRKLGAEKKTWDDAQWTAAFQQDPMLLKRPVLEVDGVAIATGFRAPAVEALERATSGGE